MIKVFNAFILVFQIFFGFANTISGNEYMDSVKNSYDEYYIVEDTNLSFGDYTLVFGMYDGDYYLSCFLYNEGVSVNQKIKVLVNGDDVTTFVPDSSVVAGFGLELNEDDCFDIFVMDNNNETIIGSYKVSDLINDFNNHKLIGEGTGDFPKNKKEINAINTIKGFLLGFVLLSILFVIILIVLYKKRLGRFSENYKSDPLFDFEKDYYDNEEEDDENIIDVESDNVEVQEVNKQEVMDRLFEEYRHGDITEDELNERLKKLWWKEND